MFAAEIDAGNNLAFDLDTGRQLFVKVMETYAPCADLFDLRLFFPQSPQHILNPADQNGDGKQALSVIRRPLQVVPQALLEQSSVHP